MHIQKKLNRYSSEYRGFVITYRPSTAVNPIARYEVSIGEQSFGLFDTQAQATVFIDQLHSEHETAA
ncbi:hypothetical protein [Gibbsiella quercinecans]|uniref:hypothetical protein n=1 Tax=Gibbsiella quercinecans TaxID=929813 RepID=UPI003A4E1EF8